MEFKNINKVKKEYTMDREYILELGKMTNAIDNLIKNQDKHYNDLRDMIQSQKTQTDIEVKNLKNDVNAIERKRELSEDIVKERLDKLERFDIKIVAYITIITILMSVIVKLIPTVVKMLEVTPT